MLTVIEHDSFVKQAKKILTEEQREELIDFISVYYDQGSVVNGTGGVQKIRFAHQTGKGKIGAARIIYLVLMKSTVCIYWIFLRKTLKKI